MGRIDEKWADSKVKDFDPVAFDVFIVIGREELNHFRCLDVL